MDDRQHGTPHAADGSPGGPATGDYPGRQLGLPEDGPGSVAPGWRRLVAIFVDWMMCVVIAYGWLSDGGAPEASEWAFLVFGVLSALTVGTIGFTPGKRLLGLRVQSVTGGRLTFPRGLLRTLLLLLVIPAVVYDGDQRGLHDRLSGAVQVRI